MPTKTKRDEEKWQKAKDLAAKSGKAENFAYIMGIYKKMDPDYEFKSGPDAKTAAVQLTQDQKDQVIQLLKKYPIPIPDKPVHDLSDKLKIETDELESYIYGLAQAAITEKIPGGLADGKNPADFDPQAIAKGIKVELEHTDDKDVAREISMDHLTEDPKYYDKLERMEADKTARSTLPEIRTLQRLMNTIMTVGRDVMKAIDLSPNYEDQIYWYEEASKMFDEIAQDTRLLGNQIPALRIRALEQLREQHQQDREYHMDSPKGRRYQFAASRLADRYMKRTQA
jgi:hypothetical protein